MPRLELLQLLVDHERDLARLRMVRRQIGRGRRRRRVCGRLVLRSPRGVLHWLLSLQTLLLAPSLEPSAGLGPREQNGQRCTTSVATV